MLEGIFDVQEGISDAQQGIVDVHWGIADVRKGINDVQEGRQEVHWGGPSMPLGTRWKRPRPREPGTAVGRVAVGVAVDRQVSILDRAVLGFPQEERTDHDGD